jgi:ATP-dependent Clp protease ATP-binding subunit ClpA
MTAGHEGQPITQEVLRDAAASKYDFDLNHFSRESKRQKLKNLSEYFEKNVIGQSQAKEAIMSLWRRKLTGTGNAEIVDSILLVGPSGVGKSYLAQVSADLMGYLPHTVHMTNFATEHDIDEFKRIIYTEVKTHPFRVFILDKFEKANVRVQDTVLSMLETGQFEVKDSSITGNPLTLRASTKNSVFIFTSNAQHRAVQEMLEKKETNGRVNDSDLRRCLSGQPLPTSFYFCTGEDLISNPIMNRILHVVPMGNPSKEEFSQGIRLYLKKTLERESLKNGVKFVLKNEEKFVNAIVESYSKLSDYRDISRALTAVESQIAEVILDSDFEEESQKEVQIKWDQKYAPMKPTVDHHPMVS